MKMGRRLRCSSVTYRFRYAPFLAPCRRPILIATKAMLFMGQDTSVSSQTKGLQINDKKSADVRFGPQAPRGHEDKLGADRSR